MFTDFPLKIKFKNNDSNCTPTTEPTCCKIIRPRSGDSSFLCSQGTRKYHFSALINPGSGAQRYCHLHLPTMSSGTDLSRARNKPPTDTSLPLEIILKILGHSVALQPWRSRSSYILRFLLLGRGVYSNALRLLYHTIVLRTFKGVQLLSRALKQTPHLGDFVINLWIRDPDQSHTLYSYPAGQEISTLVLSLKNLERVAVHHLCLFEDADSSVNLTKLRTVRIHGHLSAHYVGETLPRAFTNIKYLYVDLPTLPGSDFPQIVAPGTIVGSFLELGFKPLVYFELNVNTRIFQVVTSFLETSIAKDKRIHLEGKDWTEESTEDTLYYDWISTE